ncbi:acetolactate decarboxylase [Candidatus Auribacterota bacterium]
MKLFNRGILAAACIIALSGCVSSPEKNEVLYQVSTIDAILDGQYDGTVTVGKLKKHGDFGIGTYDGLYGEMVAIYGEFYQVKADGTVSVVPDSMTSPFAVVTDFKCDKFVTYDKAVDYTQLTQFIDKLLPTNNIFYAIKVKGVYDHVKTRSVPKQEKPYPRLSEVVKEQPTFEFKNVPGTIVGFRCPPFVKGISVPRYHLHFITDDKKGGGHLLECNIKRSKIYIDEIHSLFLVLPETGSYYRADLEKTKKGEIEKVER